jgi:hypothetical protein
MHIVLMQSDKFIVHIVTHTHKDGEENIKF